MKEFDENMAAELMLAALSPERRSLFSTDNAIEVIDLIFDYYEDAGLTDLDFDDEDDTTYRLSVVMRSLMLRRFSPRTEKRRLLPRKK